MQMLPAVRRSVRSDARAEDTVAMLCMQCCTSSIDLYEWCTADVVFITNIFVDLRRLSFSFGVRQTRVPNANGHWTCWQRCQKSAERGELWGSDTHKNTSAIPTSAAKNIHVFWVHRTVSLQVVENDNYQITLIMLWWLLIHELILSRILGSPVAEIHRAVGIASTKRNYNNFVVYFQSTRYSRNACIVQFISWDPDDLLTVACTWHQKAKLWDYAYSQARCSTITPNPLCGYENPV